jgi:membrane-bound serine protease (ClpP class)
MCPAAPRIVAVTVDGVVHPVTVEIISHALDQASREHADALLLRLNTPGGLLDASRLAIEKLIAAPVPVITFVTPSGGRAASAGFFLLEAGDVAAMANGTNTGAASPVLMGREMDPVMRSKVENDTAALLRSLVSRRGRNTEVAESTVLKAKSFTEKEALDQHLIDLVVSNEADLLDKLEGREVTRFDGHKQTLHTARAVVSEYELTIREKVVRSIADPNLAFLMLLAGALGLYVEFSHPGLIVPGTLGAILLLLGLSGLSVFPINWAGVALLVLAVALFVLEAKFATHGILGVGGTAAMVLGALLLIEGPPEMRIRLGTAIAVTLPFALITILLLTLVIRARAAKVITGTSGMLDEIGVAVTGLDPAGKVFVHGEYWNAEAPAPVAAGVQVRVKAVEGMTLRVEPLQGTRA